MRNRCWKKIQTAIMGIVTATMLIGMLSFPTQAAGLVINPVQATVVLAGDTPSTAENFKISLTRLNATNPMPSGTTGNTAQTTIAGAGNGNFGNITYTAAGVFSYEVTQIPGSKAGYTYDTRTYRVDVYVKNGASGLEQDAVVITDTKTGNKVSAIKFYNSYLDQSNTGKKGNLEISMKLEGAFPAGDKVEVKVEFVGTGNTSYFYTDAAGNVLGQIKSGDKIDLGNGDKIIIVGLPAGCKYTVTQTPKAYYTPNPIIGVYTGTIESKKTKTAPFINTYDPSKPAPASIDPPVQKQVSGKQAPKDSVFTFKLQADNPGYPMPKDAKGGMKTVQITGAGSVEMGWITYTKPGTYTYRITEVNQKLKGYTYDTTIYTMTVKVKDNSGILQATKATVNNQKKQVNQVVFVNKYGKGQEVIRPTRSPILSILTGDDTKIRPYVIGVVVGISMLILLLIIGKKRRDDEKKQREAEKRRKNEKRRRH